MSLPSRLKDTSGLTASAVLIALVTICAWFVRDRLHELVSRRPAFIPAVMVGLAVVTVLTAAALVLERQFLLTAWTRRVSEWTGLRRVTRQSKIEVWLDQMGDPLEALMEPLMRISPARRMADQWAAAGMGGKASRFILLVLAAMAVGWWAGSRIAGTVFGMALAVAFPMAVARFVRARAVAEKARFSEQFPGGLDALAGGLGAGFSLPQAVDFARGELGEPIAEVFHRLHRRLMLGWTIDAALADMLDQHNEEGMELVVEGIRLQRQFGGDLIRMLEDAAVLLRDREELDREVRAITSQGRLSGWVIAGLVPVSAGILFLTNPGYIDVLFDTLIGQVLMVIVLVLQLIGWAVISRLVRIQY